MALYPRNVLIVDDEPLIRLILADALGEVGFTVTEASNVLEAVAILGQTQIDAIVADVDMPGGLNGFDLLRPAALQGRGKSPPHLGIQPIGLVADRREGFQLYGPVGGREADCHWVSPSAGGMWEGRGLSGCPSPPRRP